MIFLRFNLVLTTLVLSSVVTLSAKSLPQVILKDLQNQGATISQFTGEQLTLINFWATYCVPCRKEMKHLQKLQAGYADSGVTVIGVAIDGPRTANRIKSTVKSNRLSYTILLDSEQKLYGALNTTALPFSILVNAKGDIVWEHTGYIPGDELAMEATVRKELGLKPGKD